MACDKQQGPVVVLKWSYDGLTYRLVWVDEGRDGELPGAVVEQLCEDALGGDRWDSPTATDEEGALALAVMLCGAFCSLAGVLYHGQESKPLILPSGSFYVELLIAAKELHLVGQSARLSVRTTGGSGE